MDVDPRPEWIDALLGEAGLPAAREVVGLSGGANNRVYRVDWGGGSALLKAYFFHPDDPRDRLGAEFDFSRFAWDCGLRCLPRPLACDRPRRLGLYEFVEGRVLGPGEPTEAHLEQAIAFYRELNRHKDAPAARALPLASEACFTLREHLACVERRVGRLEQLEGDSPEDEEAQQWIRGRLAPAWRAIRDRVLQMAAKRGVELDQAVVDRDRRLSPSDFGFHNAILAADGRLRFIDFEYAGWDDPAKMVCDFLCQPGVPVPAEWGDALARAAVADLSDPSGHLRRIDLLKDVYRIKWCCIMLNEFLPAGRQRRRFAQEALAEAARKRNQLHKLADALRSVGDLARESIARR